MVSMKRRLVFVMVLFFSFVYGTYGVCGATGDVLYQNCATGSCSGAGSNVGWIRTVESSGCYSGSCLKLEGLWNSGQNEYGAGSTARSTGEATDGHDEITVSFYVKYSESTRSISHANFKTHRPFTKDHIEAPPSGKYYLATLAGQNLVKTNDIWISPNAGELVIEDVFSPLDETVTYIGDNRHLIYNGDGTWRTGTSKNIAGTFSVNGQNGFDNNWVHVRHWIKLPSTPTASNGESKMWINDVLLWHLYDSSMSSGNKETLSYFTFYPSSEASEPFEHWMDEMIIYEGYVPPSGPVQDSEAPTVTAFDVPSTVTSLTVPINSFSATDDVSVSGYLITESAAIPSLGNPSWSGSAPSSFTLSSSGSTTLYAWARDASGKISSSLSDPVFYNDSAPAVCNNSNIETGEECDDGVANGQICSPLYGQDCTYCSSTCSLVTLQGSFCGDSVCDLEEDCGSCSDCTCSGSTVLAISEDTHLNINDINYYSSQVLNTYTWPANTVANAIIMKLNLSEIENISDISSVQLGLYLTDSGIDSLYDISAHRIINYNPALNLATGNSYDGTNPWTSSLAQDDIFSAEDTKSIDTTLGYKYWNITEMINYWIQNPSENYGLLLNSDSLASSDSYRTFASLENSNSSILPKLIILYNDSPCVHEADKSSCDGIISFLELNDYIQEWILGNVNIGDLIDVVNLWRG